MDQKPKIIYFDIRGRAEAIRLLLEDVGVDYEDVRVSREEWPEMRPTTPFGRVPIYREGSLEIPETYAILNHLGRQHGLLGVDRASRIRCDVTVEAFRDYGNRVATVFGALSGASDEARAAFVQEELPDRMAALESFYTEGKAGTGFWAGESATVADFVAFCSIEGIQNQSPKALSDFKGLQEFQARFSSRPRIRDYLASSRRPAALFFGPHGKIYPRRSS